MTGEYNPDPAMSTEIKWIKIFTWRGNGDGINPNGNTDIEDSFIRTQESHVTKNPIKGLLKLNPINHWLKIDRNLKWGV